MSAYCKISDRCRCVSERDICPNWITPPTETPAPLSDRLREACSPLRPLLDEAAAQITSLTERVAALTAERDQAQSDLADEARNYVDLEKSYAAQAAELAQARKAMAWRPIEEAPPNLPYPVAYGWYPNIVGLARRVNSEWQSVIDDGGDFVPISEPDLFLVLPALATPPAPSGSPEEEKGCN